MNILYISHLSTNVAAGLNWSVPAGIKAQEKIDNCLWIDLYNNEMQHWHETKCFHQLREFGSRLHLNLLPPPFNHPDIVVFEGFYELREPIFASELRKNKIPYVIIPRGSLTYQAMNNHSKLKKRIAHFLFFDKYVTKATAIQYLTADEYRNSGDKWNKRHYILPNGFSTPQNTKISFNNNRIQAVFIGRLDMYHKGIDVLLDACNQIQEELRHANFKLCFYGPKKYDYELILQTIKKYRMQDFITMGGEITGKPKEDIILASDLFVLTSRFEGHPMGLIEALAYGVPALVTPGSNMANEIKAADAGWVCDDLSSEKIVYMLKKIISEKELYMAKSENAKELAKPYDWDKLAIKMHDYLSSLL